MWEWIKKLFKKPKVESSASECKYTPNTIKNSMIGIGVKSERARRVGASTLAKKAKMTFQTVIH